MSQTTTVYILNQTAHPGADGEVASLVSPKIESASYYSINKDFQTIAWSFSDNFVGTCTLQATLSDNPTSDEQWVTLVAINPSSTHTGFTNVTGKFVYIRAVMSDWTMGNINFVSLSY